MKSLLMGESASADQVQAIEAAFVSGPGIDRVIHMRPLNLGPKELLLAAKVAVTTTDTADEIAGAINRAGLGARQALAPMTLLIYLDRGAAEEPA